MNTPKNRSVEMASILVFAVGLFVLISLVSYRFHDPSFMNNAVRLPKNACGRVGADLAAILLYGLGFGAFLLPVIVGLLAVAIYRQREAKLILGSVTGITLALVSFATLLGLKEKYWNYGGGELYFGGIVGAWTAENLLQQLNDVGSWLVASVVFCLALVLVLPLGVMHWGIQLARFFRQSLRQFWAKRLELRVKQIGEEPSVGGGPTPLSTPPIHSPELSAEPCFASPRISDDVPHLASEIEILPRELEESSTVAPKERLSLKPKSGQWQLPVLEFLRNPPLVESAVDRERLIANSQILKQKFADFGIEGEVTAVRPGPVITLYEFKPGPGVKVSRIAALADDLSMALSAQSVRILAPLPGKAVVGIEIPSEAREMVFLREFLQHPDFYGPKHMIPVVMGKDIGGQTYLSDLARMPHLLCAGQTGSGKSVFMNGLICSLFYRFTPDELRMILVDPKFIEFRAYQDIPHLLLPVVDDPKHASIALKWAVREMERRYRILAKLGVRNLASFNAKLEEMGSDIVKDLLYAEDPAESGSVSGSERSQKDWIEAFEPNEAGVPRIGKLPYIVVIIDELADLMMIAKKEVEISIARIAQKARAAGIHLVIATQRPSTDVVTGLIKANLPSRVSFQLASYVDSKTILDRAGAERLLGQGDMLFIPPGVSQNLRLHGAYLDDEEIGKITGFLRSQGKPAYRDEILIADEEEEESESDTSQIDDALFQEGVQLVRNSGHASASFLQRNLKIGYNRAARMIETMEERGIVGPQDGARPREVLMR